VTGDSALTTFSGSVGGIIGDGHKVTYDRSANSGLGGKT